MIITRLELNDISVCSSLEVLILIKALFSILVEGLQVGYFGTLLQEVGEVEIQFTDKHAKLCAPVTNVVNSNDIIAHELKDTTDAISLDGRAQVADMHVLCNVW